MKRNLKKFFLVVLLVSLTTTLFAGNLQKLYTVNDDIYKRVDRLTREAGVIGPSSFSPVNGRVLQIALERIDTSKLSASQRKEYNDLYNEIVNDEDVNTMLNADNFAANISMGINLGLYLEDYDSYDYMYQKVDHRNDSIIPYRYRKPFASITPQLYYGDFAYIEGTLSIQNNNRRSYESTLGWLITGANGSITVYGFGSYENSFAPDMPYRGVLSLGNDSISFVLGRMPHSIGSGITGNMVVGDNFIYQEIANLSFVSKYFSYNISVTRFDQMDSCSNTDGEWDISNGATFSRNEFSGLQQFRVVHRFDLNLFSKFRFAVDLATIYNGNGLDMRFFYPFVLAHNYYNYTNNLEKETFDEANNSMAFSIEVTPFKGLTLSGQFIVDQLQMYFEAKDSIPAAWGYLINAKYSMPIRNKGHLDLWTEFVYTNPYLYLNGKYDDNDIDYNLDYIVGYHTKHIQDYGYSGYQFGPDNIVFALGAEYNSSQWTIGFQGMYRISGKKRLGNFFKDVNITIIDMSNSIIENDSSIYMNAKTPTGGWKYAEHFIQPKIYTTRNFDYYNVQIYLAVAFNTYINYDNEPSNNKFLPQFTIGVTWSGINMDWFR